MSIEKRLIKLAAYAVKKQIKKAKKNGGKK